MTADRDDLHDLLPRFVGLEAAGKLLARLERLCRRNRSEWVLMGTGCEMRHTLIDYPRRRCRLNRGR